MRLNVVLGSFLLPPPFRMVMLTLRNLSIGPPTRPTVLSGRTDCLAWVLCSDMACGLAYCNDGLLAVILDTAVFPDTRNHITPLALLPPS